MTSSTQYRSTALIRRDNQTKEIINKKSQIIAQKLLNIEQIKKAKHVFIYVHFRSEVETKELITTLLTTEKTVSVPFCSPEEYLLEAVAITKLNQLAPGAWGILEPPQKLVRQAKIDPAMIEIIIMPGVAFDYHGGRIGYGGGFYDRFVAKNPQAQRIALSFELQIFPRLPLKPHDQMVDTIVTEKRVILTERGQAKPCQLPLCPVI